MIREICDICSKDITSFNKSKTYNLRAEDRRYKNELFDFVICDDCEKKLEQKIVELFEEEGINLKKKKRIECREKLKNKLKERWVDICVVVIIVIAFCLILTSCGAVDNNKQKVSVHKIDNRLVADKYTGIVYAEYECDKYGRKIYIPYYCKHGFLCRYDKKRNKVYCIFEKHDMYEEKDLIIKNKKKEGILNGE